MSFADTALIVDALNDTRAGQGLFQLTTDVVFDLTEIGMQGTITVPAGYVTDFASVPFLFRWLFPTTGRVSRPALLHDQLSRMGDRRATKAFYRAMKLCGVPLWQRAPMAAFVAVFTFPELYLLKG